MIPPGLRCGKRCRPSSGCVSGPGELGRRPDEVSDPFLGVLLHHGGLWLKVTEGAHGRLYVRVGNERAGRAAVASA